MSARELHNQLAGLRFDNGLPAKMKPEEYSRFCDAVVVVLRGIEKYDRDEELPT